MVTSLTLSDVEPGIRCKVTLVTLESKQYSLDWSVQNGLVLKSIDGEAVPAGGRGFEDLN